jgi:flagellar secretion chaperone FliS
VNPFNAYTKAHELVDDNDKRKVLVKVLRTLPEKIDGIKVLIDQKKYERKYEELTKITMVLSILDQSLDMSYGEIPQNLSALYQYLIRRLNEVHSTLDAKILDECRTIIGQISDGFAEAYDQVKQTSPRQLAADGSSSSIQGQI